MYVPEDAGEGCWLEKPHKPAVANVSGPDWMQCRRCGHLDYSGDPWFSCYFCGQLHKPGSDDG